MYAYIHNWGLLRLTPRAQAIITQGIGVYVMLLLQPTQTNTRTAKPHPASVYHPTATARLPVPSDTDIIFFTDTSGTKQRSPTVGCAPVGVSWPTDGLHVEQHTRAIIFGTSFQGELLTLWDTVRATSPAKTIRPLKILVLVDTTVTFTSQSASPNYAPKGARVWPHHKAIGTVDGLRRHAPPGRPAHRQTGIPPLHIPPTHAKQQSTHHTQRLEHARLDTTNHSHLQHLPLIPSAPQPPHQIL